MSRPKITIIVARASNGVIGRDGALPWHIPADLKRFKTLTMGTVLVMGRKTFESLPGLLPGRRHVVLSRNAGWSASGAEIVRTPAEAIAACGDQPISVIGGAQVFALFADHADRIELTEVIGDVDGDTVMPDPRAAGSWRETGRKEHPAQGGRPAYRFITLERD